MQEIKKHYLSKEKVEELKKEYKELIQLREKKLKDEAPFSIQSGETNPEYLSFEEELNFLNSRINTLKNILNNYEIIKPPPKTQRDKIGLGARITVEVEGDKDEFVIVDSLEANPAVGKISKDSPVGSALFGHRVGDEVIVSSPVKTIYKILKIEY